MLNMLHFNTHCSPWWIKKSEIVKLTNLYSIVTRIFISSLCVGHHLHYVPVRTSWIACILSNRTKIDVPARPAVYTNDTNLLIGVIVRLFITLVLYIINSNVLCWKMWLIWALQKWKKKQDSQNDESKYVLQFLKKISVWYSWTIFCSWSASCGQMCRQFSFWLIKKTKSIKFEYISVSLPSSAN